MAIATPIPTPTPTTIALDPAVKRELARLKVHPRETYNEVVARLLNERRDQSAEDGRRAG